MTNGRAREEETTMAVEKSLISGSTAMLVMKLLEEKDMYGYEMIETLREKSENVFELKAGTLYPLLHTLEEKGCLVSYEQDAGGKTRKYYGLTKTGKKQLAKKEEEWMWADCLLLLHQTSSVDKNVIPVKHG